MGVQALEDLWDDLDLLGSDSHYAGAVVLKELPVAQETTVDGDRSTGYEVVDGQQRLTTCLLRQSSRQRLTQFDG